MWTSEGFGISQLCQRILYPTLSPHYFITHHFEGGVFPQFENKNLKKTKTSGSKVRGGVWMVKGIWRELGILGSHTQESTTWAHMSTGLDFKV